MTQNLDLKTQLLSFPWKLVSIDHSIFPDFKGLFYFKPLDQMLDFESKSNTAKENEAEDCLHCT